MGSVKHVTEDGRLSNELMNAGSKLVVVDFTATWCGPCQRIAPVFNDLAGRYSKALFLKIDVDQCPDTAASQGVSAMPTFMFFRNRAKLDKFSGADPAALEAKIRRYYSADEQGDTDCGIPGQVRNARSSHGSSGGACASRRPTAPSSCSSRSACSSGSSSGRLGACSSRSGCSSGSSRSPAVAQGRCRR